MTIRKILIVVPLIVILFLLQSYIWVPTYEQQTKGNPGRLEEYITASIGDAAMLNPILSADTASSSIESMVFEGLIDRDEDLRFRGRLATSWEIHEVAYFYINKNAVVPGIGKATGEEIVRRLREAMERQGSLPKDVQKALENIREIALLPPRSFSEKTHKRTDQGQRTRELVEVQVKAPSRIKMVLSRVDQDLFHRLQHILGKDYFTSFDGPGHISLGTGNAGEEVDREKNLSLYAKEILPAVEHNPVILFHLRKGVKFQDGHEFDANDVKFTYQAIINPKNLSPRIPDYEPVKQVQVLDLNTVRIVYKRLYSPAFGTWGMGILPEHLLNDKALRREAQRLGEDPETFTMRQSGFNRRPIGCGPFVFREWKSDQYIILDRFDDYWEGPPNYKKYVFRIVPDLLTQEMEFYAGTVDAYNVQPHQVQRLENDPKYQGFSGLSFGYSYVGYNMRREPFNDRRVRMALSMAIDVDKFIKYVLYGQGERITGPFVEQTDYYDHKIKPIPYDPEGALKLLAEAGWQRNRAGWLEKDGKKLQFTLITNSGNPLREALLPIIQNAWKKIGVDVSTDRIEWSVFIQERVDKADFDALILGWQMGIDPDLYQIWHSSQTHPHQLNFVGFKNPEADELIIKIRQEYDHKKQVEYCHQLHEIIAQEQPYTFLYVAKWTAVLDKRIVIKEVGPGGKVTYRKITPTKTGSYTFYFNKWIKLPEAPDFTPDG